MYIYYTVCVQVGAYDTRCMLLRERPSQESGRRRCRRPSRKTDGRCRRPLLCRYRKWAAAEMAAVIVIVLYINNALTALRPEAGCPNGRCVYRCLAPRLFACQWQRIRHLSIIYYSSTINKGRRCYSYSYSYINAVQHYNNRNISWAY